MTFKQAQEFKAHVRKGEQGSLVVYADKIIRTETDADTGNAVEHAIPFMKGYTVFNVEQIDGLPERFYAKAEPRSDTVQRIAHADSFIAATGAVVRHGGNMAYYSVSSDHIQMPPIEAFRDAEAYYATLLHETGGLRRRKRMAREPLSAELFREAIARAELFHEAIAVAAEEAKRDGKDVSRLQVSRIDAIVDELKKNALRKRISDQKRG
jgi:antirestriction protein ArdC